MLAYRLARGSGILDVEAWRDTISPEVFDAWVAFDQVEEEPLTRIAEILKLGFASLVSTWGAEVTPEQFEPRREARAAKHVAGPAEAAAVMRAAIRC